VRRNVFFPFVDGNNGYKHKYEIKEINSQQCSKQINRIQLGMCKLWYFCSDFRNMPYLAFILQVYETANRRESA